MKISELKPGPDDRVIVISRRFGEGFKTNGPVEVMMKKGSHGKENYVIVGSADLEVVRTTYREVGNE